MLTIIYFLLGTILTDSTPSYEQLAADYFFGTIWKQEYKDYKSIEFGNKTDSSIYAGNIHGCEKWNEADKIEIEKGKTLPSLILPRSNSSESGSSI